MEKIDSLYYYDFYFMGKFVKRFNSYSAAKKLLLGTKT